MIASGLSGSVPRPKDSAVADGQNPREGDHSVKKAVRAGAFVVGGYGVSQVIRLGGNLVLTRLLFPELFAMMAIANVFTTGLALLSDIGLGPAVIRSPRSSEPVLLNTAWTIQVIRGLILWALAVAVAVPVSRFYQEPRLVYLLPVIALNSLIDGFRSTATFILQKELRQVLLNAMEIVRQVAGLVVMIAIAYVYQTVWALVAGRLVSSLLFTVWSHFISPTTERNRFLLDRAAARELIRFGKWILLSTGIMFFATQADRLLLGRLFPLAFFGVYSIAAGLAELPKQVMNRISDRVIYPFLSTFSDLPRNELRMRISHERWLVVAVLAVIVGILGSFGDIFVLFLYDPRYEEASWIFPLLITGMWPLVLYGTIDRSLYVIGKPQYVAFGNLTKFAYMLIAVPVAFRLGGALGAVLAVALNDLPMYAVNAFALKREELAQFRQDILATLLLVGVMAGCLVLRSITGLGMPWRLTSWG